MNQVNKMSRSEQYAASAHIVGMRMQHPYVAVHRSGERIEITFLKIPISSIVLPFQGYEKTLSWMVFNCLLEQHSRHTSEEQVEFNEFLECSNGVYGTYSMMTPGMMVFGFIQLLPESGVEL